jgi:uncharacterized protein (DUF169 family)
MKGLRFKFQDNYHDQWITVKFYREKPTGVVYPIVTFNRMCEALTRAIRSPLLIDLHTFSCLGAKYSLNGNIDTGKEVFPLLKEKRGISEEQSLALLEGIPQLHNSMSYIGLNVEEEPDLILASIRPADMMQLLKTYQNKMAENLHVELSGLMGVCAQVVVKTFLTEKISISFGCDDSRKYAKIGRDKLIVGIPKRLFNLFIEERNV